MEAAVSGNIIVRDEQVLKGAFLPRSTENRMKNRKKRSRSTKKIFFNNFPVQWTISNENARLFNRLSKKKLESRTPTRLFWLNTDFKKSPFQYISISDFRLKANETEPCLRKLVTSAGRSAT